MGRFQKSAMASVLSGALAFGAIGVGATGASAESAASARTQAAPAGCDSLAKFFKKWSDLHAYLEVPELPALTAAKLVYRKQRGTVSVAFADKVEQALDATDSKKAHKILRDVARDIAGNGDPAAASVGAELDEAVREYAEGVKKLKKAALSWPRGIKDEPDAKTKRSAAEAAAVTAEAAAVAAAEAVKEREAKHYLAVEAYFDHMNYHFSDWPTEAESDALDEADPDRGGFGNAFLAAALLLGVDQAADNMKAAGVNAKAAAKAAKAARKAVPRIETEAAEMATSVYTERTRLATLNLQAKQSKLFSALTASYTLCNPLPAENTDGDDVPSPNANTPGKTPTPAATPQPQTTTTTYYETTTTTDPYCYEHPTLGYICE